MEEFYTVKEIAEILKVNRVTIQRWCKTSEIPAVKIGKSYRIEKKDFENWYQAKKGERGFQEELRF
ncbi:MAG: helix-turn-helix domain-containing protein [bacterium]